VRVEGYLASRGGSVGTDFVKVRTGDSAWKIAQDNQGIPVWVLEAYNPSVDLDALRPGQELMVPVLADVVVDAANETPAVQ
jgi:LysM repeat protein